MMEWLLKTGSCGGLDYMVPDFTEVSIATEKRRKTMTSMLDNEIENVLSSFENQLFLPNSLYIIYDELVCFRPRWRSRVKLQNFCQF